MKNHFNFFHVVVLIVVCVIQLGFGADNLYEKTASGFFGETAISAVDPKGRYVAIASSLGGKQVMQVNLQLQVGDNMLASGNGLVFQNEEDLNHYNSIECMWLPYKITFVVPYSNTEIEPAIEEIKKEGGFKVDLKRKTISSEIQAHVREKIYVLAFSNDGKYLASSGWFDDDALLQPGVDEKGKKVWVSPEYKPQEVPIKIWGISDHKLVLLKVLSGHKNGVMGFAFSGDDKRLVSFGYGAEIINWDLDTGEILNRIKNKINGNSISLSYDGKTLVVGDKDKPLIHIINIETGVETNKLTGFDKKGINSVAFSHDGKFLASAGTLKKNKTIIIWNTNDWTPTIAELGHKKNILTLAFDSDSKHLISGDEKDNICLWDVEGGKLLKTFDKTKVGSFDSEIIYTENDELVYFDSKSYEIKRIKITQ